MNPINVMEKKSFQLNKNKYNNFLSNHQLTNKMFGYDFYSILNSSNKIRFFLIIIFIIYIMEKFIIKINFFNNKVNSTIINNKEYNNRTFNKSDIKVCLCVMGKEENIYAKEFINHYKKLGYNHIFLYDNNDLNGEKFEDVLKEEINERLVSIINYRGKKGKKGKIGGIQLEIYYDCYEKNNKDYDWLSFYDFDEFLELKPNNLTIQQFLGNKRYKKCQNVKINFQHYSDNELLYYDNRPVQERFTTPVYNYYSRVIKSTVRGRLKINYWKKSNGAHTSLMKYISCNSEGKIIKYYSYMNLPVNYKYAALKHYYTKSVEEYCNKSIRGEAFYPNIIFNEKRKKQKMEMYFKINKKNDEKIKLFKKLFSLN